MYLYTLLAITYADVDLDDNYYTSIDTLVLTVPSVYNAIIYDLNKYRNIIAHECIINTKNIFTKLRDCRFEVDALAALCNVTLNWENSLNLNL